MPSSTAYIERYKGRQRRYLMVALAGAEFERVATPRKWLDEYARRGWKVKVLTPNGSHLTSSFDTRYEAVDWAIARLGLKDTIT